MKNKKLTVSVGTSAYNEEQNIANMLRSVISQKEKTIKIAEIIVISDGSKDNTVALAKSVKDNRIKIIDDGRRMGKAARVGELLKRFSGDVLVVLDSDMIMKGKKTIENMVKKFIEDRKTALVCGNAQPIPARSFLESAINNYIYARNYFYKQFNFGNTAYSAHGFLAYSKAFAQTLTIPSGVLNDDAYSYFMCMSKGYKHYFAKNAVVMYRSPSSIKDHIHQSIRHLAGGDQLCEYFGKEVVDMGFYVPKEINLRLLIYQSVKNPLGYAFVKLLNFYCKLRSKALYRKLDIRWATIKSSKMSIL
ncbi:MAG: glycosyl transferase family protein [uncultured bacterium]|nr:MAG: glycosyl transferase family protein [uncultured bacterium]OGH13855.1 MAG: hypothetical protein A2687_04815 [Candidatus Levybacteria bacterium RIFCSPHIGHO2_01_FULL_38_26]